MTSTVQKMVTRTGWILSAAVVFGLLAGAGWAAGYGNALKGVTGFDAVYEVSQGNPAVANVVFWAVKNSYETAEVKTLPKGSNVVVVLHGPAVKLISSSKGAFSDADWAEVQKFQDTLRQMRKGGVGLEVCDYAVKVMGVDPATIIPEVDHVPNGFVSVVGYQMQGYAVVRVP